MMPFLMLGLAGIIQQPFDAARFSNYGLIEGLFERIEKDPGSSLNFETSGCRIFCSPAHSM